MYLCPICNFTTVRKKIFDNLPTSSAILDYAPSHTQGTASFDAAICDNCDHLSNSSTSRFEQVYSDDRYVVKTAVSGAMNKNLQSIAEFISPQSFENCMVLEIASGSGELANWLAEKGCSVITVDPAIKEYENKKIVHFSSNFDSAFVKARKQRYDLIIGRHIIEHTNDPIRFLSMCSELLTDTGRIYLEVPNLANTLSTNRYVDFFNDHMQYFSENSMRLLASKVNLKLENITFWLKEAHMGILLSKGDGYLCEMTTLNIKERLDVSEQKFLSLLEDLNNFHNIVIYGAGAHACTFVSQLSEQVRSKVSHIFDKSAEKQGRFIPGLDISITHPIIVDRSVLVNTSSLYQIEVEKYLRNDLGWIGPVLHL